MLHNPTGKYIDINGERFYCIENYNHMQPFFISLASDTDLWMYISSTGGLTCGRRNPEQVLFPYYTDDKITENYEQTGPKTILRVQMEQGTKLWEPFSSRQMGMYQISRSIAKSVVGNRLIFIEKNIDLGITFSYEWAPATHLGWVRTARLSNDTDTPVTVEVLDGLQNVMPSGVERVTQNTFSTLVDGYKRTEHVGNGMVLFRMEAILVDRAEPSESLRCNSIYTLGLDNAQYLCSSAQLDAFRMGMAIQPEPESKGVRGAIFAHFTTTLPVKDISLPLTSNLSPISSSPNSLQWHFVCDVMQDAVAVRRNMAFMQQPDAIEQLQAALQTTTCNLRQIVAQNDGVQHTADEANDARHFANTLFNTMRGGFYCNSYQISGPAFAAHVALFNHALADKHHTFLSDLPESISYAELDQAVQDRQDHQLHRLFMEYLPLTFSRRHGDPSRPWNLFDIRVKDEQDRHIISYQGNWRDIFQNWEALSLSYPDFTNSIIAKFLNATTADGYNPYKVTSEGIDWEVIEPENPWSNIGYWGDHQIIYLCRLLELSYAHNPATLRQLLGMREFAFANVPYRFKSYSDIVRDPKNTITFDQTAHEHIFAQLPTYGQDARLVMGIDQQPLLVTFTEKILVTLLTKLSNFIPEAGIWMNTLRPEWNDANNALVGNGASMVTLYYMRRFVAFLIDLYQSEETTYALSEEVVLFLRNILTTMVNHLPEQAEQPICFTDHTRRSFTDQMGRAGEAYRNAIYAGHSGKKVEMDASLICQFLIMTLDFIDQSIDVNQREDGLYHAYNLVKFDRGTISISHLYEMLEGQVAVLSSRRLNAEQTADLLDAMRQSALYREDQRSYMLYPARKRASFLDMNNLPKEALSLPIVQRLLANHATDILTQDCQGGVHFSADFNNADFLLRAIQRSNEEISSEETEQLLNLYEQLFNHHAFTGRSGTFYKYEGLGCIYWHMVSKLLLAVGECIQASNLSPLTSRLISHYSEIREGIGSHKTPAEYGSFPFDAYSHTPSYGVPENARGVLGCHAGVQQPGMTGQVKEDIISRFFELGVQVQNGQITFCPTMLTDADFCDGELCFTYCGTEIIYRKTAHGTGSVTLTPEQSKHIFARDGEIKQLIIEL